ncbi:phage tail assembly protein [Carnimonas bestiolae]|uniref:phage tail assembly protein n=1 Tax=Carnimonas bestiolae TaxID=3402172 RepID=UPI003EDC71F5
MSKEQANTITDAVKPHTITLQTAITHDGGEIKEVTLRAPKAGSLRGISLAEAVRMEADAIVKLVPRISSPMLSEHQMNQLSAADLFAFGSEIVGFLLPQQDQTAE